MKRLPKTPASADPATLRWVAQLLDVHAERARELKSGVPGAVMYAERMNGQIALAFDVAASLRKRAGQVEGRRRRRRP